MRTLPDTVSRIGGITLKDIAAQMDAQHSKAFDPLGLAYRPDAGQPWADTRCAVRARSTCYNPQTIHMLQQATRRWQLRNVLRIYSDGG